ncbi:MAG: amino acid ABC transporter permease [Actinobacteria bacterium]|nr:amino acid ABC transporter permease [Actinomycetota bacterium]NBY14874.1 amino acid ABC transporter permease [Actinomycetota bacterium]
MTNPDSPIRREPDRAIAWSPSVREQERAKIRKDELHKRIAISVSSSALVLAVIVAVLINSPGWDVVKQTFFDLRYGQTVVDVVAKGLLLNIELTVIASVAIGALSLALALARTTRSASLTPIRFLATAYVDIFRGVPLILVILLVGFGVPALRLQGVTSNVFILGTVAIVLTYSAYVAEVIRSGILSVHPSQRAAARSLGLTHNQTMRYVVLPQALRRVVPPILNDFISLLKDTGLVSILGVIDAVRAAQIESSRTFNYTPYVIAAILFLIITIPLTRYTDYVLLKSIEKQNSQGAA